MNPEELGMPPEGETMPAPEGEVPQEGGMPPGMEEMMAQMGGGMEDPAMMEEQPDMAQDPMQLEDEGLMHSPADSMMDEEVDAGEALSLDPVADALPHHILMYIDFASEVRKDKTLNLQVRSKILLDMAQAVSYFVPLLPSSDDAAAQREADMEMKEKELELKKQEMTFQLQLKAQEHQMNMQMKQEEMQMKQQENQMKLQMTQETNQQKLRQQEENHQHNIVQGQESHQTKMEQQKQAAQLKQSNKQGSDNS